MFIPDNSVVRDYSDSSTSVAAHENAVINVTRYRIKSNEH